MSIFQDVTLQHNDKEYVVKKENVLMLIASVEEVISIQDLAKDKPSMARVAMGYAEALKFAGCKVTGEEIYSALFEDEGAAEVAAQAVTGLLSLMLPPERLNRFKPKKKPSRAKKKAS